MCQKALQSKEQNIDEVDQQLLNSSQATSNEETMKKNFSLIEEPYLSSLNKSNENLKENDKLSSFEFKEDTLKIVEAPSVSNSEPIKESMEAFQLNSKKILEKNTVSTSNDTNLCFKETEKGNIKNISEFNVQLNADLTLSSNEMSSIIIEKTNEIISVSNDIIVINDDSIEINKNNDKLMSVLKPSISKDINFEDLPEQSKTSLLINEESAHSYLKSSLTTEKNIKETLPISSISKTITPVEENDLASSVWVRGISNTTKAADLKALFSKHGKVQAAKIFTTKNKLSPTCFGYITMCDSCSADLAIQKLNRTNLKGKVITVEKANHSLLSQINRTTKASSNTPVSSNTDVGSSEKIKTTSINVTFHTATLPATNMEKTLSSNNLDAVKPTNISDNTIKKDDTKQLSKDSSPEIIILDKESSKTSVIKTSTNLQKKDDPSKKKIISTKSTSQSDNLTKKIVKLPTISSSKRANNTTRTSRGNGSSSTALRSTASHRSARAIVAESKRRQFISSSNRGNTRQLSTRSSENRSRFENRASKSSIRITKTLNGGIHVSTRRGNTSNQGPNSGSYSTRGYGYSNSARYSTSSNKYSRTSNGSYQNLGYSGESNISTSEREQMLRLMRKREDEYRKKEEELRFQREKEKLRFERERLEREKLEVQQLKLTAQLANAQYAAFLNPTATQSSNNNASTTNYSALLNENQLTNSNTSNSKRGSSRDCSKNKEPISSSKSSYKSTGSYQKNSNHKARNHTSSTRGASSRRGESSSATNRGSRKFDKNISERKRPFSRSPFRSSNSNRDDQFKVPFKTIKPGYEHHQRSSTGSSGTYHQADYSQYPSSRFNNSASMNDFHHSSDNLYDNFNNSTAITVDPTRRGPNRTLDKQSYDGGRSRISDSARSNRRSPFSNGRRSSPRRSDSKNSSSRSRDTEFLISGLSSSSRGSLGNDQAQSYASRTDPSYASRIANLTVGNAMRNSSGVNSADEMFGTGGYGRDSMGYGVLNSGGSRISNETSAYRDPLSFQNPISNQWNNNASTNRNYDLGGSSSWSTKNDSFGMGQQNPLGQGNNSYWNRELENSEQNWGNFESVPVSSRYSGGGVGSYDNKHSYSRRY